METQTLQNVELYSEVKNIVLTSVNLGHLDASAVSEDTALREGGLNLDSVDMLEVVVAIEQHFGVKVTNAEVGKKYFRTLGGIVEFIASQKSAEA